jgi:predicted transcriptional regulator
MSLFDVLGSKPRLQILQELTAQPRYVSELADRVGMDGKTAAHHLSVLEEAELVESYWRSQRKYYRLVRRVELAASPPPERTFVLSAGEARDEEAADGETAGSGTEPARLD